MMSMLFVQFGCVVNGKDQAFGWRVTLAEGKTVDGSGVEPVPNTTSEGEEVGVGLMGLFQKALNNGIFSIPRRRSGRM